MKKETARVKVNSESVTRGAKWIIEKRRSGLHTVTSLELLNQHSHDNHHTIYRFSLSVFKQTSIPTRLQSKVAQSLPLSTMASPSGNDLFIKTSSGPDGQPGVLSCTIILHLMHNHLPLSVWYPPPVPLLHITWTVLQSFFLIVLFYSLLILTIYLLGEVDVITTIPLIFSFAPYLPFVSSTFLWT